jgi:hypothetical protein
VVQAGPRLGNFEAGAVAAVVGTEASVVFGGLACIAGIAALSRLMPRFSSYRLDVTEPPVEPADPLSAESPT